MGLAVKVTQTVMKPAEDRFALAYQCPEFACELAGSSLEETDR